MHPNLNLKTGTTVENEIALRDPCPQCSGCIAVIKHCSRHGLSHGQQNGFCCLIKQSVKGSIMYVTEFQAGNFIKIGAVREPHLF